MRILTITDEQKKYAQTLINRLKEHNFRVEMDESTDHISGKIKNAQLEKIPWMLVIGKKEVENNTVTLRYNDGKQEPGISFDDVLKKALDQCSD